MGDFIRLLQCGRFCLEELLDKFLVTQGISENLYSIKLLLTGTAFPIGNGYIIIDVIT